MIRKQVCVFVFIVASLSTPTLAQVVRAPQDSVTVQDSVTAKASPFTDQLRKTVVFLRTTFVKAGKVWEIKGTGFLISYPDERAGAGRGFTYLVTNRHMAVPGAEDGHSYPVQGFYVRTNVKNHSPDSNELPKSLEFPLGPNGGAAWSFPADPSVDLAATLVSPQEISADFVAIPVSQIATKQIIEDKQISAGDQVLFAGYFYQFPGEKRVQPIVRQGILSMIPDELIGTTLKKLGNVYLADIHAFHGNSGSPIFVNTGGFRVGTVSNPAYMLLGVVSGYYPESETDFSVPAARVLTGEVHDNSGVTVIVPGDEVKALLDSPQLREVREGKAKAFLNRE